MKEAAIEMLRQDEEFSNFVEWRPRGLKNLGIFYHESER